VAAIFKFDDFLLKKVLTPGWCGDIIQFVRESGQTKKDFKKIKVWY